MQITWELDLKKSTKNAPSEQLTDILSSESKELGIFLSYYFKKDGAVAENVSLVDIPNFENENSGKLRLAFDLVYFNACLAIHEQNRESILIDFNIDEKDGNLILKGPDWPDRGLDDI